MLLLKPSAHIFSTYFVNKHVQQWIVWWKNNIAHDSAKESQYVNIAIIVESVSLQSRTT